MEIIGVKIGVVVFCAFMAYFSFFAYRRRYFGPAAFVIWALIFLTVAVATAFSQSFIPFSEFLRFARLYDLFVAIAILFLLTISFINFVQNHTLKKKLEEMVQEKALKE